jgi:hypothetical protein
MKNLYIFLFITFSLSLISCQKKETTNNIKSVSKIKEKIFIDKIWSPTRVGFYLMTHDDEQFIAYYNSERRMVVAKRNLKDTTFDKRVLPSKSEKPPTRKTSSTVQGWDSHNSIKMAIDNAGHIHLAGNMHANKLTYFYSTKPYDIHSLVQIDNMIGNRENRCTYPKFNKLKDGSFIFHYRDGGSGNGVEVFNIFDTNTKKWSRLFDKPFISGEGKMNAYQNGPRLGPDGKYHILWVWRDTPDASTNHDLSYAMSNDFVNWKNVFGEKLKLPITIRSKDTIVDPIPVKGGIINGCHHYSFDRKKRLIISYHKHDENGHTQAYVARLDNGKWNIKAISNWKSTHIFKGGGTGPSTFGTSLRLGAIKKHQDKYLALPFSHWIAGKGLLVIDEETLEFVRVDKNIIKKQAPTEMNKLISKFKGMQVRIQGGPDNEKKRQVKYLMKWETLGSNRDRPRPKPWPGNSDLFLYTVKK